MARIHTVVVTHSHPDHFGGAARLRAETGADILTHASFQLWWERGDGLDDRPSDALDDPEAWSRPTPWGTRFQPPNDGAVHKMRDEMASNDHRPHPTKRVEDSDVVWLAGREWVAMHTPGHTPDHLCLFDPAHGVVLSGDHVLPTITPHIGAMDGAAADPLAEFFHALDRMAALPDVSVALPAHGHPFHDLAGRAKDIKEHHAGRLQRLRDASVELGRPGDRARADAAPVRRAGVGLDGRVGDVRPPRAPPPQPRGHVELVRRPPPLRDQRVATSSRASRRHQG